MKRCIICGNVGDENSTTCGVCGNPYVDMPDDVVNAGRGRDSVQEQNFQPSEPVQSVEENVVELKTEQPMQQEKTVSEPAVRNTRAAASRRRKSGPQIYGQEGMVSEPVQGMVRKNVQGKMLEKPDQAAGTASGMMQDSPSKEAAALESAKMERQGAPAGRPVNGPQGAPAGRPMNRTQGMSQGRPANGPQGAPAGRPVNGPQGAPAGRPVNGPQGTPAGRPVNGPQGAPSGRPVNIPQGMPSGRPINIPQGRSAVRAGEIVETARGAIKSPLFILVVILNTIYLAGSVAAIFMKELNFSQYARLLADVDFPTQFVGYLDKFLVLMSKLDTDAIVVNLIMRIPDMLLCIGLWLILVMAFTAKEEMSGIGFGFAKIVLIINMIKNCLLILIGLIVSVALVVAAWVSATGGMTVASVITLVFMIVLAMLVIMYYFSYMATLKTIRLNADKGESYGRVSLYVAIVNIVLALASIVNLLSGIVNAEISNIAGAAGKMGWLILFSVWIFSYRGSMSEFEEE